MAIIGIAAIARNFAIGRGGKLPWHYAADLKYFKETTGGNAVVMGIKTYQAIGHPLPNRLNIVLSSSEKLEPRPGVLPLRDREQVMALAPYLNCDIFVIGGAKTYQCFADVLEKWIVTEVPDIVPDADAFLPADFLKDFVLQASQELGGGLKVKFYSRIASTALETTLGG